MIFVGEHIPYGHQFNDGGEWKNRWATRNDDGSWTPGDEYHPGRCYEVRPTP